MVPQASPISDEMTTAALRGPGEMFGWPMILEIQ